jgi:hypothetical protein
MGRASMSHDGTAEYQLVSAVGGAVANGSARSVRTSVRATALRGKTCVPTRATVAIVTVDGGTTLTGAQQHSPAQLQCAAFSGGGVCVAADADNEAIAMLDMAMCASSLCDADGAAPCAPCPLPCCGHTPIRPRVAPNAANQRAKRPAENRRSTPRGMLQR